MELRVSNAVKILIAPMRSKYVSPQHIRHAWSCESCDHYLETSDNLRPIASSKDGSKILFACSRVIS
jgi:hypothetical protein